MDITPYRDAARRFILALLLAGGLAGLAPAAGLAQSLPDIRTPSIEMPDLDADPDGDEPDIASPALPDTKGALVFHGNYCGPGSRGAGLPPVDALDEACMHHDACSPPAGQGLPSCGCNARLRQEAARVARSPGAPDDLRLTAKVVSEGAKIMACR